MKKIFLSLVAISLALALASCSKSDSSEQTTPEAEGTQSISFTASEISRVSGNEFEDYDAISVNAYEGGEPFASAEYEYNNNSFISSSPISYTGEAKSLSYNAVYPAQEDAATTFTFTVETNQSGEGVYEKNDLLVATLDATSSTQPELTFRHKLTSVLLNISYTGREVEIASVKVWALGTISCDVVEDSYTATGSAFDFTPASNGDNSYKVILAPQTISSADTFITIIDEEGNSYPISVSEDKVLASGSQYTITCEVDYDEGTVSVKFTDVTIEDWNNGGSLSVNPDIRTLTFEDEDYVGGDNYISEQSWSSLIDDAQYNGTLLYGGNADSWFGAYTQYEWTDENNTWLHSNVNEDWSGGTYALWNGGDAISNYVNSEVVSGMSYDIQLSVNIKDEVTGFGGYNGSKNFAVHNGYNDISFADGEKHVIDHMYVANTTYFVSSATYGDDFANPIAAGDWVKIFATGYDLNGDVTGTAEFFLAEDGVIAEGWNKFDLSGLGKVSMVTFSIDGSESTYVSGYYGDYFPYPAYFAFDDVTVIF